MLPTRLLVTVLLAAAYLLSISQSQDVNVNEIEVLKNQFLPAEYKNTNLTIGDLKMLLKEKCRKASGADNFTLYQEVERGALRLVKCFSGIANLIALQEEIEKARPIGELDTVFYKYCQKVPELETCFKEFTAVIQPCLNKDERSQNAVTVRIFSGLLKFMCSRDGDQIALFVAEDGPECFETNKEAISHCVNKTLSKFLPQKGLVPTLLNLPDFVVQPEHCIDLSNFETCTLHHLEQCRDTTPANLVESVFKFIKNETNCKSWLKSKFTERSALKNAKMSKASLANKSISVGLLGVFLGIFFKVF